MTEKQLEFTVFCVESVAERTGINGGDIYEIMTEETNVIDDYVIPHFDVLHTQGKDYIVDDLLEIIRERGGEI